MVKCSSTLSYVVGKNTLFDSAKSVLALGNRPLLLCGTVQYEQTKSLFVKYLTRYGCMLSYRFLDENLTLTGTMSEELADFGYDHGVDLVIGFGGTSTLAISYQVATILGLPLVVIPTTYLISDVLLHSGVMTEKQADLYIFDITFFEHPIPERLEESFSTGLSALSERQKSDDSTFWQSQTGKICQNWILENRQTVLSDQRLLKEYLEINVYILSYLYQDQSVVQALG